MAAKVTVLLKKVIPTLGI